MQIFDSKLFRLLIHRTTEKVLLSGGKIYVLGEVKSHRKRQI
jgi:hypothetical protein